MKNAPIALLFLLASCSSPVEPTNQIPERLPLSVERVCDFIGWNRTRVSELSTSRFVDERYFYVSRSLDSGETLTLIGGFDDGCLRTLPLRPDRARSVLGIVTLLYPVPFFSSFPDVQIWFDNNFSQHLADSDEVLVFLFAGEGSDRVEYWLVFEPSGFVIGNVRGGDIGTLTISGE